IPARGVRVVVEVRDDAAGWSELACGTTDDDGRIAAFQPPLGALKPGVFRLRFATDDYFRASHLPSFYPELQVIVRLDDPAPHYHVPLLLSPFGYSTYRGR